MLVQGLIGTIEIVLTADWIRISGIVFALLYDARKEEMGLCHRLMGNQPRSSFLALPEI